MPNRDASTCTVLKLKDAKYLRIWVEYHRVLLWSPMIHVYILVDQKNFFDQKEWKYMVSLEGIKALEWASEQADIKLIEWPLLSADLGVVSACAHTYIHTYICSYIYLS